jgi:hypothetical protein
MRLYTFQHVFILKIFRFSLSYFKKQHIDRSSNMSQPNSKSVHKNIIIFQVCCSNYLKFARPMCPFFWKGSKKLFYLRLMHILLFKRKGLFIGNVWLFLVVKVLSLSFSCLYRPLLSNSSCLQASHDCCSPHTH